jgi:hypothetical protein
MRIISDFLAELERRGLYPKSRMDDIQAIEKHLREAPIVKMERILAGTAFYGRAEAEFANAMEDETNVNRRNEMERRYQELAQKVQNLTRAERERTLFDEIEKWKSESGSSS